MFCEVQRGSYNLKESAPYPDTSSTVRGTHLYVIRVPRAVCVRIVAIGGGVLYM